MIGENRGLADSEDPVAQQRYLHKADVRTAGEIEPSPEYTLSSLPSGGASECCAYNQTRERFLSGNVEIADLSVSSFDGPLPVLTPGADEALWIVPYRAISPTNVRIPLDLLYLDRNCIVLEAVESFPISRVSPSCAGAASVLVLQVHTIVRGRTHPGDQLILCDPEEMKWRLQLADASIDAQTLERTVFGKSTNADTDPPTPTATDPVLEWDDDPQPILSSDDAPTEVPHIVESPLLEPASSQDLGEVAHTNANAPKNWLQRLFSFGPPQPRNAPRESLSWLVAYFFTGGIPVAHGIRDVSLSGLYVFTAERWYPDTVVRMTLTDRRRPTVERCITINAKVVRCGDDGVGLQFILHDKKKDKHDLRRGVLHDPDSPVVTKVQLKQFLQLLRSGSS